MSKLRLLWWQAKMLKEQIDIAEKASALGCEGKLTMDSGCVVEWDNSNVKLEIPEDEDNEDDTIRSKHVELVMQKWEQLSREEKDTFLKEMKGN